jgi:methionyl-tRNA formyltransferase
VRLVFLGTPELAVPPLRALHAAGHDIALVVTRADARRGRGSAMTPSPVKATAVELGLDVTHDIDDVLHAGAELGVVVAYGRIIKPHILEAVPMINIHFSLLPRWRGAAPVERALLAGDEETGVCLMAVEEGLDTGGVYSRATVRIGPESTAAELRDELVTVGTRLLVEALERGLGEPEPQVGEVTYAEKISAGERELDWLRPAAQLDRIVRVGDAYTWFRGDRLKIHTAAFDASVDGAPGELVDGAIAAAGGGLRPSDVQPAGRSTMRWHDFLNGIRPRGGERFGSDTARSTVGVDE